MSTSRTGTSQLPNLPPSGFSVAVLWDESFLWGVMAHRALCAAGLPFDLIRSADVRAGKLSGYSLLFVPGGWASNKIKALGPEGMEAVRKFVADGGTYLGFCGGAGLATEDGVGLLPIKRRPTKERVPSFSGRIGLRTIDHPLWNGLKNSALSAQHSEPIFHAWWPSQFVVDGPRVNVLASYGEAMPDAFSSDVNVGDVEARGGWAKLEQVYGINLDPARLKGEPAVVEGIYGKGRVLLSLIHFDTPEDANGARVLKNIWKHLAPEASNQLWNAHSTRLRRAQSSRSGQAPCGMWNEPPASNLKKIKDAADGLIALGERNQLWSWRNPMLLQWKRGVRGLEYCTLSVLIREIAERMSEEKVKQQEIKEGLARIRSLLLPFTEKAGRLLSREHKIMQIEHITYERCDDPDIQALRDELFSRSKSHGGMFKELLDEIDRLLYEVIAS